MATNSHHRTDFRTCVTSGVGNDHFPTPHTPVLIQFFSDSPAPQQRLAQQCASRPAWSLIIANGLTLMAFPVCFDMELTQVLWFFCASSCVSFNELAKEINTQPQTQPCDDTPRSVLLSLTLDISQLRPWLHPLVLGNTTPVGWVLHQLLDSHIRIQQVIHCSDPPQYQVVESRVLFHQQTHMESNRRPARDSSQGASIIKRNATPSFPAVLSLLLTSLISARFHPLPPNFRWARKFLFGDPRRSNCLPFYCALVC